jgi:hypothetical protein
MGPFGFAQGRLFVGSRSLSRATPLPQDDKRNVKGEGQECPSHTSLLGATEVVPLPNLFAGAGAGARVLWDDGAMSKRSTRIAKRDEFENALKEVEEKLRSRRGKNPEAVEPAVTEERDGESGEDEVPEGK